MARCPICGKVGKPSREWDLGKIHVKQYECCEKSSVNTKRRFRSRGVFVMGLLGWLRREKEEVEGGARLRKE